MFRFVHENQNLGSMGRGHHPEASRYTYGSMRRTLTYSAVGSSEHIKCIDGGTCFLNEALPFCPSPKGFVRYLSTLGMAQTVSSACQGANCSERFRWLFRTSSERMKSPWLQSGEGRRLGTDCAIFVRKNRLNAQNAGASSNRSRIPLANFVSAI